MKALFKINWKLSETSLRDKMRKNLSVFVSRHSHSPEKLVMRSRCWRGSSQESTFSEVDLGRKTVILNGRKINGKMNNGSMSQSVIYKWREQKQWLNAGVELTIMQGRSLNHSKESFSPNNTQSSRGLFMATFIVKTMWTLHCTFIHIDFSPSSPCLQLLLLLLLALPEALSGAAAVDVPVLSAVLSLPFYLLCLLFASVHVLVCTSAESSCYFCSLSWGLVFAAVAFSSALFCVLISMAMRRLPQEHKTYRKVSCFLFSPT